MVNKIEIATTAENVFSILINKPVIDIHTINGCKDAARMALEIAKIIHGEIK